MEEISKQPPEMHKTTVNNGIFTISTCAGFLPSTVCCKSSRRSWMTYISWLSQTRKPWRIWTETWWDQIKATDARLKPSKAQFIWGKSCPKWPKISMNLGEILQLPHVKKEAWNWCKRLETGSGFRWVAPWIGCMNSEGVQSTKPRSGLKVENWSRWCNYYSCCHPCSSSSSSFYDYFDGFSVER